MNNPPYTRFDNSSEVGMRAGTRQTQFGSRDTVDQEPVRLEVDLPVALPPASPPISMHR